MASNTPCPIRRLGLYGGSFNPIHSGHVNLALTAARDHALDKVLVIPAKVSPFKTQNPPVTFSDDQRWQMVAAACRPHPLLEPCDIELRRGGVSYAIDTVEALQDRYRDARLFFIIGEDSVAGLPLWKDWPRLKALATFVAYPRTPESSTEIRRRLAAGEDVTALVPKEVAARIARFKGPSAPAPCAPADTP